MKRSNLLCYIALAAPTSYAGLVPRQGIAGTTTRYWDCCKASCSWSNKAAFSAPVNTCDVNDKVLSNGRDVSSGCDSNGQGFMCSNQQPYAVNDNLAYGFTAVTGSGSEAATCCACYKLSFTSQINGKVMVVQATNIGYDVQNTQFDLALPGGGVGAFPQGCQKQYNAGMTGWGGRQYGGVASRSECAQLPAKLQPGCQFRFDWLKGADNPSISWERVSCPAELVAKSGCRRNDDGQYPAPPTSGSPPRPSLGGGNTGGGNTGGGNTGGGGGSNSGGSTATRYGQCGGVGWTGATRCESGTTCRKQNDYYSQCL